MPLWFDNSGIHCIGRVLEQRASSSVDLDGFLQFLAFLAFSDAILINGDESGNVALRTKNICAQLIDVGIPQDAVAVTATTRDDYLLACEHAAHISAYYVDATFVRQGNDPSGTFPEGLGSVLALRRLIHEHILTPLTEEVVSRVETSKEVPPAEIAVLHMLAASEPLQQSVRHLLSQSPSWAEEDSLRLDAYLRTFLNDILARQHKATYAPSPARARTIRAEKDLAIDLVMRTLDAVSARRTVHSTSLPALTRYLLIEGKGEPDNMLLAALEVRERTGALRHWLADLTALIQNDHALGLHEASIAVEELGRDLCASLKIEPRDMDLGAEITRWGLGDAVSVPITGTLRFIKNILTSGRLTALTEITKGAALSKTAEAYYDKLQRSSGLISSAHRT